MQKHRRSWLGHLVAGSVGAVFLMAGGAKLAGDPAVLEGFAAWGLPRWFVPLTGSLEVLGAALIALPLTRRAGGALLAALMLAASAIHASQADWAHLPLPVTLGALAAWTSWREGRPVG